MLQCSRYNSILKTSNLYAERNWYIGRIHSKLQHRSLRTCLKSHRHVVDTESSLEYIHVLSKTNGEFEEIHNYGKTNKQLLGRHC